MSPEDMVGKIAEDLQEEEVDELDFPEYRGLSFEEFWHKLPHNLAYAKYEEELFEALESGEPDRIKKAKKVYRKVRVKKATGLGITEFMTRYVAWKCLKDNVWRDQQIDVTVIVITGADQELTNTIIGRIKSLFTDKEFKTKESMVILNGCKIKAYPTQHLTPARGLNPRLVWVDEADFFPKRYQDEARTVAERYRLKGDAIVVLISTTNLPGGLYERMDEEDTENNGYLYLDYNYEYGIGVVWTREDMEKERKENPSFQREFNLQYGYGQGDVYDIEKLEECIQEYSTEYLGGSAGTYADPAWGSSLFGKVSGEVRDGIIYVTEAEEWPRASPNAMLDNMEESWNIHKQACKVDAANPGFIKSLTERNIPALGIAFGQQVPETEGSNTVVTLKKKLPINASSMVQKGLVRIHPEFTKLISQMRAVKFDKMGGIDKSEVPFDLVDAFDMMCWDLKSFNYTHVDVIGGKIIKKDTTEKVKKVGGLTINTEVIE
jgi:hypothetical protein